MMRPSPAAAMASRRSVVRLLGAGAAGIALPVWPALLAQPADKKLALVIGNADYKVGALKNPIADARAVASSLKALGFNVDARENTTLRDLLEALRDFSRRAPAHAVRVIFYAGHGVQSKGRNFLVPVDAEVESEDELPARAADVGELIERLGALRQGVNILILDACRANPFAGGVFVDQDGRRLRFRGSAPSGLSKMDAPVGTLVAYATSPGGIALDGQGSRHSLYTKHLLAQLSTPGLSIEQMFKRVRVGVSQESRWAQVPWESSSLMTDFCFRPDDRGRCGF